MMMTTMFFWSSGIYCLLPRDERTVGWKYNVGIYTCGKEHNRNGHKNYYAN